MAIAIAPAVTTSPALRAVTVNVTGGAATTAYTVTVSHPGGGVGHVEVTTDGSGAASFVYTSSQVGTATFAIRPSTEHKGTTAAAASGTLALTGMN